MSFFEDIIINLGQEGMYFFFKRLGMLAKWIYGQLLLADPQHVREFTLADLDRVALKCGLRTVWSRTMDSWNLGGDEVVDRVAEVLQSLPSMPQLERGDNIVALFARD